VLATYALHSHHHDGTRRLVPVLAESVPEAMQRAREVFAAHADAHTAELHIGDGNVVVWNLHSRR
jgi:hypothetical protein